MNLVELAEKKEQILKDTAGQPIYCPYCGDNVFSPFDKLYIIAFERCHTCDTGDQEELDRKAENIFELL